MWNGCGSETRKDERKQTEIRVREPRKNAREIRQERMGKRRSENGYDNWTSHCEAETESQKGRNRKLSSAVLKRKWTKENESQATVPIKRFKGNHLWNSCGSEAGKNERKPSESRVREPGRNA